MGILTMGLRCITFLLLLSSYVLTGNRVLIETNYGKTFVVQAKNSLEESKISTNLKASAVSLDCGTKIALSVKQQPTIIFSNTRKQKKLKGLYKVGGCSFIIKAPEGHHVEAKC